MRKEGAPNAYGWDGTRQKWKGSTLTRMQTNRTKINDQLDQLSVPGLRRVHMKIGRLKSREREHTAKSNCSITGLRRTPWKACGDSHGSTQFMMTRRGEVLTLVTSNRSKMPWESMSSSRCKVQAADNLEQADASYIKSGQNGMENYVKISHQHC